MSTTYLIVGESGTGKSTSIGKVDQLGLIGLNPKETAIINVMGKPMPFRGSRVDYGAMISEGGNYASVSDAKTIIKIIAVLKERQDIKNVIIDDWQYILAQEFMDKALKKGYDKFNEIAKNGFETINAGKTLRPDQNFICMAHSDFDEKAGTYKLKTIGKMLDDKVNLAGLFTVVLYTHVEAARKDGETLVSYNFVTNKYINNSGIEIPAKSPIGMFNEILIPNDLGLVIQKATEYYN
jgi:hypothetical protein|tara:strand:+ start:4327 stop:5040 length:714 start_codon:yes stop_codon:yes gene_type:complete